MAWEEALGETTKTWVSGDQGRFERLRDTGSERSHQH